jgi:hypothetical protein
MPQVERAQDPREPVPGPVVQAGKPVPVCKRMETGLEVPTWAQAAESRRKRMQGQPGIPVRKLEAEEEKAEWFLRATAQERGQEQEERREAARAGERAWSFQGTASAEESRRGAASG